VLNMKKKHYSFLDQRRTDFDVDYEEFCKSTSELHVSKILQTQHICLLPPYCIVLLLIRYTSVHTHTFLWTDLIRQEVKTRVAFIVVLS